MVAPGIGERVEVFTDSNDDYAHILPVYYFRVESLCYGQLVKVRDERGRLAGKERRGVFGDLEVGLIETVNMENFNGILRERLGRLVRRTKCVSKEK